MKIHRSGFGREASAEFDHPMVEIYVDNLENLGHQRHLSYFAHGLHQGQAGGRIVREEMENILPKVNQQAQT
ncbi:hypothetical protein IFM47457_00649 [Aspergillus lentulus]|nr:hypothetical protein IFM47457_00649 [Aspergillus lentulus]